MLPSRFWAQVAVSLVFAPWANAEQHTIKYDNRCGTGQPELILYGKDVLQGADTYTSEGPISGISYLQTGQCGLNGEKCTLMEMTLINPDPSTPGSGSSTDISLIPPHVYNVETSFAYYSGCDGQGRTCDNPNCVGDAFFNPNDNYVQVECQANDANILIAFCANASEIVLGGGSTPSVSSTPISVPTTSGGPSPTSSTPNTGPTTSDALLYASSLPPSSPSVTPATPTLSPTLIPTSTPTDTDPECGEPSDYPPPPPQSTPTPTDVPDSGSSFTTPPTMPTPTDIDPGCDEPTGPITPPSEPTSIPASTPSSVPAPDSVPPVPSVSTPPTSTPPVVVLPLETESPPPVPTASQRCRPRPSTSLGLGSSVPASGSLPTGPAVSGPVTPVGSIPASSATSSPAQRRRRHHRRSHDHHLRH